MTMFIEEWASVSDKDKAELLCLTLEEFEKLKAGKLK